MSNSRRLRRSVEKGARSRRAARDALYSVIVLPGVVAAIELGTSIGGIAGVGVALGVSAATIGFAGWAARRKVPGP